ncbi:NF038129 family PEP-CTERM protein [Duganella violaceipulchra]|uniref:NF038129 family PEP-CTERM protein n=1 Tax=Duganella violaceipulchra TaxID=2849652 RepID=A0AA41L1W9_9BURK|nr:NF038129 family PEP-CTERM protein [Duganella violaceicalia]MBV6319464.1 NF038129 family PEP-CTERM protein [Duganella violaceicalia]MCP2006725.1 hypothetical protein [Duganella violaceicalia]
MTSPVHSLLRRVALAALLASGAASAATIHVAIDTAGLGTASGYLDLQLSATAGVPLATAVMSNLAGFDSSAYIDSWGVTALGGGYQFRNDTSNDLFHAVAFGGVLSFDLTFNGEPDPLTRYVSHFVVSAYDDGNTPLGHYNPVSGALADFSWTPGLSAQQAGTIGVAIADARVSLVPEPATWTMMGLGWMAMTAASRRRRGRGA